MGPGDRLNGIIEARGLKKRWVAEQMGISPSYLSRLLSGERAWTPELRSSIADTLEVPEETLFLACDDRRADNNDHRTDEEAA